MIGKTIGIEFENVSGAQHVDRVWTTYGWKARPRLPEPQPIVNLLANAGFEDGVVEPWTSYGDVTMEISDDAIEGNSSLHVTVGSAGANFWDLRPAAHRTRVSKPASSTRFPPSSSAAKGRWISTSSPNWRPTRGRVLATRSLTMTDEWTEFSVTTPVLETDVDPAAITFHIGFAAADFWIDGVRFYEGEYVPAD